MTDDEKAVLFFQQAGVTADEMGELSEHGVGLSKSGAMKVAAELRRRVALEDNPGEHAGSLAFADEMEGVAGRGESGGELVVRGSEMDPDQGYRAFCREMGVTEDEMTYDPDLGTGLSQSGARKVVAGLREQAALTTDPEEAAELGGIADRLEATTRPA